MHEFIPVLSKEEIEQKVAETARKISSDYKNRNLVMIGILKGSFIFLADLVRQLTIPVEIDFIQVSSYGNNMSSSGNIKISNDIKTDIKDKYVLIVEDIVDTGLTLTRIMEHVQAFDPKHIGICAMIDKCERRETEISVNYAVHMVEEGFLVGYGLDYAEKYRELPGIYHLKL